MWRNCRLRMESTIMNLRSQLREWSWATLRGTSKARVHRCAVFWQLTSIIAAIALTCGKGVRRAWLLFLSLPLVAATAPAQITVSSTATISGVPRAGINLSTEAYYASAVTQNYFTNPGFELPQFGHVIQVSNVVGSTITDGNDPHDPANFWNDATCSVRVGTCSGGGNNYCRSDSECAPSGVCSAGETFTISSYGGGGWTCSGACPQLAAATTSGTANTDVVACRVTINPATWPSLGNMKNWDNPWMQSDVTDVFVTNTQAHTGNSSLEIQGGGGSQGVSFLWDNAGSTPSVCSNSLASICTGNGDCPSGGTCQTSAPIVPTHPVAGAGWEFSFWAWTNTSNVTCTANLSRAGGNASISNQSFNITPNGSWNQYSYGFAGKDASGQNGPLNFTFNCSGGTVYIDDMFLGESNGVAGGWRSEVLQTLQAMNPGSLRGMNDHSSWNAWSEAQSTGSDFAAPPMGLSEAFGVSPAPSTFTDVVQLANAVSPTTSPWLVIPMGWSDSEYSAFGTQLCSWMSTYHPPNIFVEFNNEDWNGALSPGVKILPPYSLAYGEAASRAFSLMTTTCSDSNIIFLINNQTNNNGVISKAIQKILNTPQYGASTHLYVQGPINSQDSLTNALGNFFNYIGSCTGGSGIPCLIAPGDAFDATNQSALQSNQVLANYEWSIEPDQKSGGGTGGALIASQVGVGFGSAGLSMYDLLLALQIPGVSNAQQISVTNAWQLVQSEYLGTDEFGLVAGNWGTDRDFAPSWPWLRPAGLAIELYNSVVSGDYHACSNVPSGIACAAFYNSAGSTWQAAMANSNPTSSPVSITFPAGTVPQFGEQIFYTKGLSDNNEASNSVKIGSLSTKASGQQVSFTIPAYGAVVLAQTLVATPTPTVTSTPGPTGSSTPGPTGTPVASPTSTRTPVSAPTPTATSSPGQGLTPTPTPAETPTPPVPTPKATSVPKVPVILRVSGSSVNFGKVKIGKHKVKIVMLTNTANRKGGATVTFAGASISGSNEFSAATSCNGPVGPKGRCSATIGFAPIVPGAASATVAIGGNASNSPVIIGVSGTGT